MNFLKKITTLVTGLTMAIGIGLIFDHNVKVEKAEAASTGTLTINRASFSSGNHQYTSESTWTATATSPATTITGGCKMYSDAGSAGSAKDYIQTKNTETPHFHNDIPLPGNITKVTVFWYGSLGSDQPFSVYLNEVKSFSTSTGGTIIGSTAASSSAGTDFTVSNSESQYKYFYITHSGGVHYTSKIVIEYSIPNPKTPQEIIDMINDLPEASAINTGNYETYKSAAEDAKDAYDSLTDVQKDLVTNYAKLEAVLAAILAANPTPIEVYKHTFGGTLSADWSATSGATFSTNYYRIALEGSLTKKTSFTLAANVKKFVILVKSVTNNASTSSNIVIDGLDKNGNVVNGSSATFIPFNASVSSGAQIDAAINNADNDRTVEIAGQGVERIKVTYDSQNGTGTANWVIREIVVSVVYELSTENAAINHEFVGSLPAGPQNNVTLDGADFNLFVSPTHSARGYDATKGAIIGANNTTGVALLTTYGLVDASKAKRIDVNASINSGTNATLKVFIGDTQIGNTVTLTSTAAIHQFAVSSAIAQSGLVGTLRVLFEGNGCYIKALKIIGPADCIQKTVLDDVKDLIGFIIYLGCSNYADIDDLEEMYNDLTAEEKTVFEKAAYLNEVNNEVESVYGKYTYMLGFKDANDNHPDGYNPFAELTRDSNTITMILVIIGLIGLTAAAGYYIVLKRKYHAK